MRNYKALWIVKVLCMVCLFGTVFTTVLCGFANFSQVSKGVSGTNIGGLAVSVGNSMDVKAENTAVRDDKSSELSSEESSLYYISVAITADDTLWSIASRYRTDGSVSIKEYIRLIKQCNNMTSDSIYAGSHLVVPIYGL